VTRFLERIFSLFPIRKIKRGTEKQHPFGGYLPADQWLGNRLHRYFYSVFYEAHPVCPLASLFPHAFKSIYLRFVLCVVLGGVSVKQFAPAELPPPDPPSISNSPIGLCFVEALRRRCAYRSLRSQSFSLYAA